MRPLPLLAGQQAGGVGICVVADLVGAAALHGGAVREAVGDAEEVLAALYPIFFFIVIFSFMYFVLLEYSIGQTVGKILMSLKVVGENDSVDFFQAMLRSLFLIPIFPLTALWIIDPVFLFFFSKKRQRLSEYLSKTYVIDTR